MTLQTDVEDINDRLLESDTTYDIHDRGQFYIEHYQLTGSEGALLENHISMFSGAAGGNAFAANYLLADYADTPSSPFYGDYSHSLIYSLSQEVAEGFGAAVVDDALGSGNGALGINEGIDAADETWQDFDLNNELENYFPGNGIYDYGIGIGPYPDLTVNALLLASNSASFLFGKSIEDFSGLTGYETKEIDIGLDSDSDNDITYVVKHNGDRNSDGVIDYNDGVVVAVANERWDYSSPEEASQWPTNWAGIREWQPLKDFRIQLTEGGTTDFEEYFRDTQSGDLRSFWGSLEAQFDESADIRNHFYIYGRNKVGTSDADSMYGGRGNDYFAGGAGDDVIDGGAGNDELHGGAGNDLIILGNVGTGDLLSLGDVEVNGGDDIDKLDFSTLDATTLEIDLEGGTGAVHGYTHGLEGSAVYLSSLTITGIENVIGTNYNDTIIGNGANNKLEGGHGDDRLVGNGGDDHLVGGYGADTYVVNGSAPGETTIEDDSGVLVVNEVTVGGSYGHAPEGSLSSGIAIDADEDGFYQLGDYTLVEEGDGDLLVTNGSQSILLKDFESGDYGIHLGSGDLSLGSATPDNELEDEPDRQVIRYVPTTGTYFYQYESDPMPNGGEFYEYPDPIEELPDQSAHLIRHVNIEGTSGNDYYALPSGYTYDNTSSISTGAGHDIVYSNYGRLHDLNVDTGAERDFITTYGGKGTVNGGDGDDEFTLLTRLDPYYIAYNYEALTHIQGGAGRDEFTGIHAASINGGSGTDTWNVIIPTGYSNNAMNLNVPAGTLSISGTEFSTTFSNIENFNVVGQHGNDYLILGAGKDNISAGTGHNTIDGGAGDDTISSAGTDTIHGGEGSDAIYNYALASAGNGLIYGDAGNDTIYAINSTEQWTIDGGTGDDEIYGGESSDQLLGGDGEDRISDYEGNNSIEGGEGNDTLLGSGYLNGDVGDDLIYGGDTSDQLMGGEGVDSINGRDGNDSIYGNAGDDELSGEYGDDYIVAGSGADGANGFDGNDTIDGGEDDDTIGGGDGNDSLLGGDGNDRLVGDVGDDTILGGAGDDIIIDGKGYDSIDGGDGNDSIIGGTIAHGGDGNDTIGGAWEENTTPTFEFFGDGGNDTLLGAQWNDTLHGGTDNDYLVGGIGSDLVEGGDGDDYIAGTYFDTGFDTIRGGDGNDTIYAGDGTNSIDAGFGSNRIYGSSGRDTITYAFATSGVNANLWGNTITSANLNDSITAGSIEEFIFSDHNDTIIGFGDKTIIAGLGNDYIEMSGNSTVDGGEGNDTISTIWGNVSILGGEGNDSISAGDGSNTIDGGTGNDTISSYYNADLILGADGNDSISAGSGNDTINGGSGTDTIFGDWGNDSILGGDDADFISDSDGDNIIDGGSGSDTIVSGYGHDFILGGDGADSISSGTLNDTINAGEGNDTIDAGSGLNTVDAGNGDDMVMLHYAGGVSGNGTYQGGLGSDTLNVSNASGRFIISLTNAINNISNANASMTANNFEHVIGSAFNDSVLGSFGANRIEAGGGNDTITGNNGNDTIYGGVGNDSLSGVNDQDLIFGEDGNDTLNGGAGSDSLYGGDGNDLLLGLQGQNLTDGGAGADRVSYSIYGTATGVTVNLVTGTAYADAGALNDTLVSIEGVIGSNGNDIITGNAEANSLDGQFGDDTIYGGAGADTIIGNYGNDLLFGEDGNDYLNSFDGSDTLVGGLGNDVLIGFSDGLAKHFVITQEANSTDTLQDFDYSQGDKVDLSSFDNVYSLNDLTITYDSVNNQFTVQLPNQQSLLFMYSNFDPSVFIFAVPPIVYGTLGNDVINRSATTHAVEVYGLAGADTITGSAYHDTLVGGASDSTDKIDIIYGGGGHDSIVGGYSNDKLYGDAGNDTIDGGIGSDSMTGGEGDDLYLANSSTDIVVELSSEGTDTVHSSVSYTLSANVEDLTLLGTSSITATGNALNNLLVGNTASNSLNGMAGDDTMVGGLGNDTYTVDSTGDVVEEQEAQGTDKVNSSIAYILGDHLENLTLTGSSAINGTGNSFNNTIVGNVAANALYGLEGNDAINGGGGDDTLVGGLGNDTYTIDNTSVIVVELAGEGTDRVTSTVDYTLSANIENLTLAGLANISGTGNELNNSLLGNDGNNTLIGMDGNDALNGDLGTDTLIGGTGNDTYTVESTGDVVIELAGEGTDRVNSSISYVLGDHLENLTLTGASAINGTGNALNNSITGNSGANVITGLEGNDTLNGGAGDDTLIGGLGDDSYIVDSAGDVVQELSNEGNDRVTSSVDYVLGDDLENLTLSGTTAVNGTGNALNNAITGNAIANNLYGLEGNDTLTGGIENDHLYGGIGVDRLTGSAGNDIFHFNASDSGIGVNQRDIITDFTVDADKIQLDDFVYGFSWLGTGGFTAAGTGEGRYFDSGSARILSFDRDGNGVADFEIQLSSKPAITGSDFVA